jgi:hypothetical protein
MITKTKSSTITAAMTTIGNIVGGAGQQIALALELHSGRLLDNGIELDNDKEEAAIIPACFQSGPDQGVVLRSAQNLKNHRLRNSQVSLLKS